MSRYFSGVGLAAAMAAALGLGGCGSLDCTLIGCRDQLTLTVVDSEGAAVADFAGEARFDGRVVTIRCGEGHPAGTSEFECNPTGVAILGAPANLELELRASESLESFAGSVTPEYATSQPNGEGCGPICRGASVEVKLR